MLLYTASICTCSIDYNVPACSLRNQLDLYMSHNTRISRNHATSFTQSTANITGFLDPQNTVLQTDIICIAYRHNVTRCRHSAAEYTDKIWPLCFCISHIYVCHIQIQYCYIQYNVVAHNTMLLHTIQCCCTLYNVAAHYTILLHTIQCCCTWYNVAAHDTMWCIPCSCM